jgi:hypothetical protein
LPALTQRLPAHFDGTNINSSAITAPGIDGVYSFPDFIRAVNRADKSNVLSPPTGYAANIPGTMVFPTMAERDGVYTVIENGAEFNRPRGKKYYISTTGSDSSGDGSEGSPYATMDKVFTHDDYDEVIVAPGTYVRTKVMRNSPDRDVSVICEDGEAIFGAWENESWSKTGGYTNIYQTSNAVVTVCGTVQC